MARIILDELKVMGRWWDQLQLFDMEARRRILAYLQARLEQEAQQGKMPLTVSDKTSEDGPTFDEMKESTR